jgi:hypothetical protein
MHAADTFFDGLAIWAVFAFLLALAFIGLQFSSRASRLEGKLDLVLRNMGVPYPPPPSPAVQGLARQRQKVAAIALYRKETGVDLKTAKQAVEDWLKSH